MPTTIRTSCSGQSVHQQAPYSCSSTKIIDGSIFTIVENETAAGKITVAFSLKSPRNVPTPIHVTSHQGNSGSGGPQTDPTRVIPAGSTGPVTLTIPKALCGQVDVKAVFLGAGNGNGRMSGSYIVNDTCKVTPPSTTSPPPATSIVQRPPSTTVPGHHPSSPSTTVPVSHVPHGLTGSALPATGIDLALVPLALGLVFVGRGLRRIARRPRTA